MDGSPRERAPAARTLVDGPHGDDLGWRDLADAAWLAAARLAARPPDTDGPARGRASDTGSPPYPPPAQDPVGDPPPQPPPATPRPPAPPPARRSRAVDGFALPGHPYDDGEPGAALVTDPAVPSLVPARRPEPVRLAKALHGLARRVPSRHRTELDEERTARHGVSDNLWIPYVHAAEEKAFDLVVLVDGGATMRVWDETVERIATEASRSGAFRDVRTVRLELPAAGSGPATLRWAGARPGDPAELLDARGSRVHLIVTDGLGHGWTGEAADSLLDRFARSGPTALVHLLPTYLWHRSSVCPDRARLTSGGFGAPNTRVGHRPPAGTFPDPRRPSGPRRDQVPVPVLSLKADSFSAWSAVVAGGSGVERTLPVVLAGRLAGGPPAPGLRGPRISGPRAAASAVSRFLSLATPTARRLAADLAAVPFEFEVIEELCHRAAPGWGPSHVSEIMMGGLIDWEAGGAGRPDFAEGIREALLATGTRRRLTRVVSALADTPSGRDRGIRLRAAVRDPEGAALPDAASSSRSWLRTEVAVLRALSGPYAARAARMAGIMPRHPESATLTLIGSKSPSSGIKAQEAPEPPGDTVPTTSPDTPDTEARRADPAMELHASPPRYARGGQPKIMGNVPPKNPNFTGRENLLAAVEEQLRGDETAAVLPHALHGMGGVGKSQIAIEYVYRHAHEYNVIWWIASEQDSSVLAALGDLARSLNLEVGPQANTAVPAVAEALRTGKPYDNWLLVFDNAEDIDSVRRYFPTGGPGKIIVTSRNREWERVAAPLTVNVFERAESVTLLQRRARELGTEDADRLADALGDLPLAIEQAGAWCAATGMAVSEYLGLLAERRPGILELDPSPDYPVPVAAAWNISLDRLAVSNPAARELLQICSCMAPEPIPLDMLRSTRNTEISATVDPILRDPVQVARATRDLNKFSLIKLDRKNGALQMHRLMQAVLTVGVSGEEAERLRQAAHRLLAAAQPGAPETATQWPAYQALLPHVLASGAVRSSDPWVRELIEAMVLYLYYWGAHEAAESLAREAWTSWHARSGEADLKVVRMGKLLAFILLYLGRTPEAVQLNESALEVSRRLPEQEEELIDSMTQMAGALRYQGDFYRAKDLDTEAVNLARDLFGPDEPPTLKATHSLGVSLRLCGEYVAARELNRETVEQWDLLYGQANGLTLNTTNGLAMDVREAGDYPSARAMQEDTYELCAITVGEDNAMTVRMARNLAVCRRRDGDLVGASTLIEETLARFTARYGDGYPDTLAAAMNATVDRRLRGDLISARGLGEKTLARLLASLGENHAYTLIMKVNLAATLRALGETDTAKDMDAETVDRLRDVLGERHVTTLTAALGLAADHYAQLDFAAAHAVDSATLGELADICGDLHPVVLACRANLALDLRGLGRIEEADTLNAETVAALARTLREDHPWTAAARLHQRIECDIAPMPL